MGAVLEDGARVGEILAVLRKHRLDRGLTPEKLREIFEDLGATYVKLGQILSLREDLLPREYCKALESLRTEAAPMPEETVEQILQEAWGKPWQEVLGSLDRTPVGAASIAQVHTAVLPDGRRCVLKIRRPRLYETMERDVRLLKNASGLLRVTPAGGSVDFRDVLEQLWKAAKEELDFTREAEHLKEFRADCEGVRYASCPAVFESLCTPSVLVMEYVGGRQVDDREGLEADGYDRKEIAEKLITHYIDQITEYRFFHADPHPGNIRVQDGIIYWLDLGMMGRLTPREAELYRKIIRTIYDGDTRGLTDALLDISGQSDAPDKAAIRGSIRAFFKKYQSMSMAEMNMGALVEEFLALLKQHRLTLPSGLTMLGRSLIVIQGSLTGLDPDANVMEIVARYAAKDGMKEWFSAEKAREWIRAAARSGSRLSHLPNEASEFLELANEGELLLKVQKSASEAETALLGAAVSRICAAIAFAACLIAGAVFCLTDLPRFLGVPWPAVPLFAAALLSAIRLTAWGNRDIIKKSGARK
ncbi:MAG: AarF/ABC1/UbiB kinase family protein [Lachnospiraceae bacterium]|nr:AarF/ABC1/UbiB kinase family protein [Lachnospiraceae bacterium]